MISNDKYSKKRKRIKKTICDCAMSLNDDREKNPCKGKENPRVEKSIKVSIVSTPQEC